MREDRPRRMRREKIDAYSDALAARSSPHRLQASARHVDVSTPQRHAPTRAYPAAAYQASRRTPVDDELPNDAPAPNPLLWQHRTVRRSALGIAGIVGLVLSPTLGLLGYYALDASNRNKPPPATGDI